jgi:hypothetical protein
MRATLEDGLLAAALGVVLILVLAACASVAFILRTPAAAAGLSGLPSNPWWLIMRDSGPKERAPWIIAAAAAGAILGLVFSLRAYRLHKRNETPVLPYLLLFFLTLGIECVRGAAAVLYATNGSVQAGVMLTRVVYWGRFVGLFALLLASLYCTEMRYRHVYVLGGGAFLVALAIAASIPIDRTTFLSQLTWKLADQEGVWFVYAVISVLVLLTAIGAFLQKRDRRFLLVAAGMALLLTGRELLFFMDQPAGLAAAIVALAAGAAVCIRSVGAIYEKT